MSSAMLGVSHRKPTRRPGRKAPTLRPDTNTSVTAGGRVVKTTTHSSVLFLSTCHFLRLQELYAIGFRVVYVRVIHEVLAEFLMERHKQGLLSYHI